MLKELKEGIDISPQLLKYPEVAEVQQLFYRSLTWPHSVDFNSLPAHQQRALDVMSKFWHQEQYRASRIS